MFVFKDAVINTQPLNGYVVMEIDLICTFTILDFIFGGCGDTSVSQYELTDGV